MYNNLPKTLFLGQSRIYLPSCHSTNEIAASFLNKPGVHEGTLVITSEQTAGKGQRGNTWESEPHQNLTFSLILKPAFLKVTHQFNLNIAISLGVFDFLTTYLEEKVKIKWPNDIYFSDSKGSKKICGILIQNTLKKEFLENSIVGIGVNINQQNFIYGIASSLRNITGDEYSLEKLLNELLEKLEARYLTLKEGKENLLKLEYFKHLYRFNEERQFSTGEGIISGKIVGVDEIGRLLVKSDGKTLNFNFKEISFFD